MNLSIHVLKKRQVYPATASQSLLPPSFVIPDKRQKERDPGSRWMPGQVRHDILEKPMDTHIFFWYIKYYLMILG